MTKTKHKPNKELIGQGIGNSIGALFGGIPGAGATIRTVVNINAGGKTRLSGMTAGVMLLLILLAFSSIASQIPAAVLAGNSNYCRNWGYGLQRAKSNSLHAASGSVHHDRCFGFIFGLELGLCSGNRIDNRLTDVHEKDWGSNSHAF